MTVKRIRNLVAGTAAYIVPGVIHKDELHISDLLGKFKTIKNLKNIQFSEYKM